MQIDLIDSLTFLVAAAAFIFSIISFRRSEQLNTQVALQTHLAEQKNAVKKIWHESKSVIAQIDEILESGSCLNEIGKTLNTKDSKSGFTDGRALRHHFYDLYSKCFKQIEDSITAAEPYQEVRLLSSLLNIIYEGDIQPRLTGKKTKNDFRTFDILHTKSGAQSYDVLTRINRKDREDFYEKITDKATEAFCVYRLHQQKIESWLYELEMVKFDNELDNFNINQNSKLQRRFNIMFNMLSYFQSMELEYLIRLDDARDVDAGCIIHGAVTLFLFGKLAEAYVKGNYLKTEI
jgi:hypothetical protein